MTSVPPGNASRGSPARLDDAGVAGSAWSVGEWSVDGPACELSRGSASLRLEPKVFEVLVCLARRAGQVVAREELLDAVWPGVVVGDDALTQAIIKLRKALGDDARQPTYIETISKRGYRLIAPVFATPASVPAGDSGLQATFELSPKAHALAVAPRGSLKRALPWILVAGLALGAATLVAILGADIGRRLDLPWPIGAGEEARLAVAAPPVIAVLPLANQSGDPRREYFSDGVTGDIINALGRYSGLRVISRNSVDQYKARQATGRVIKEELGVRYLVKGSVREADGKLRVAVELSDADNAQVIWSERFEGEGRDVFGIQDRIVRNIVGKLAVKVTRQEQERIASKPSGGLETYDLVLRARSLVVGSDRDANREARELLARAREMAPDYAEVDVVWAMAEYNRVNFGWVEDPAVTLLSAERHARRALASDDLGAHARAHGTLGLIHSMRGNFDGALAEANRAIELNPSDAFAFDSRGTTLVWLGRLEEAIASLETGLRFDPAGRSPGSGFSLGLALYSLGRYREALAVADATIARYPQASFVHAIRASTLAQMGKTEEARKAADDVRRLDPFFPASEFGDRFVDPKYKIGLQEGLRKAGF